MIHKPHDTQGNIVRGYKHLHHVAYLFFEIKKSKQVRSLLRELLPQSARAGEEWTVRTDKHWHDKLTVQRALNVAFTYPGLKELKWHAPFDEATGLDAFREGMFARARDQLRDTEKNDPERWWKGLRDEAHVLFTLYWHDQDAREAELGELLERFEYNGMKQIHCQLADAKRKGEDVIRREHFGFRDGFSQPVLPTPTQRRSPVGEGVLEPWSAQIGRPRWRPLRLGEFLLGHTDEDGVRAGGDDPYWLLGNGTFMVWRKLEQHVEEFEQFIAQRAETDAQRTWLRAKLVGRWPDGTSLVDSPYAPPAGASRRKPNNEFDYRDDEAGARCPLGAHVRRANPRTSLKWWTERTRRHRIIRRGVAYDEREQQGGRGLIFVCFNASIERQFELIQGRWLRDGDAFGLGSEEDPLLGQRDGDAKVTIQGNRNSAAMFLHPLRRFVTTRGGYYLFVPGMRALELIASGPSPTGRKRG